MKFSKIFIGLLASSLLVTACKKDYQNPNAPTKDDVLKSQDGLLGLCVATRATFSVGGQSPLYGAAVCSGLSAGELYVINTGNGDLAAMQSGGGNLGNGNATIGSLWIGANLTRNYAQLLIDNAGNIGDVNTRAGVTAYGHIFKAMSIATMAQFWQQVPAEIVSGSDYLTGKRTTFKDRRAGLEEAIALLTTARDLVAATAPSATFNTAVLGSANAAGDMSLRNTCNALIARYQNMLGNTGAALTAARAVDTTAAGGTSYFRYEAVNPNPLFRSGFVTNNVIGGNNNFGLSGALTPDTAAAGRDARLAFFLGSTSSSRVTGYFNADATSIPLYTPDEIALIIAECLARQATPDLTGAIAEVNRVRTRTNDPTGVNARLAAFAPATPTQAVVLQEIYRQRCIELYLSGMKLEDSRRFGRPGPGAAGSERNRNYYPYPTQERDNNTNTPADPAD